jgi:hypothetical protein
MTNAIDIECPNCGRTIRSSVIKCPHCRIQLNFFNIDDLEKVAKDLGNVEVKSVSIDKENDKTTDEDKNRFLGKLFGRGKK